LTKFLLHKTYDYDHNLILAKKYSRIFSELLRKNSYDVIFAPAASTEIALLQTEIPIIYASDATYRVIKDYYPAYSDVLEYSAKVADRIEKLALSKAAAIVYSTPWPVQSAIQGYGIDESKIHVIPYGANIDSVPLKDALLSKRKSERCRLVFLAVDWKRKGGDIAFETFLELDRIGIPTDLVVVGCVPPQQFRHPNCTIIPFLDKNVEEEKKRLNEILLSSDFLILPTRAEASAIVFCEASAFGLPSIATDTGGGGRSRP